MRIEGAMQQAERRRLARAGRADQGDRLAGLDREGDVAHRRALAVIGEGDVLEGDGACEPAEDPWRSGRSRTRRRRVEHLEELGIFGACMKMKLTKLTTCSSRATSMVAMLMKVTISPTVVRPCMNSQVPTTKIARTVRVAEARVPIAAIAHQDRTGFCAASSRSMMTRSSRTSASMRVKLWITGTLPSASEARSARSP